MSARTMKKIRKEAGKHNRRNVHYIRDAMIKARRAQIRRALIGAIIIGMFAFAISRVMG